MTKTNDGQYVIINKYHVAFREF